MAESSALHLSYHHVPDPNQLNLILKQARHQLLVTKVRKV